MRLFFLLFINLLWFTSAFSQQGWNWPENKSTAEEKNVLYTDYLKQGDCNSALEPHKWLMDSVPDLHVSLYQNGIKIYQCLIKSEKDKVKRNELIAKALEMFDLRIKYFKREDYVLNRKAYYAYQYYKSNKGEYGNIYKLFNRAYELNNKNISNTNLVSFMDLIRRYKLSFPDSISDDEILEQYTMITDIISQKIVTENINISIHNEEESTKYINALERLKKYQALIDEMLTSTVTVDCNFIFNKLGPKLTNLTSNLEGEIMQTDYDDVSPVSGDSEVLKLSKEIFNLARKNKCGYTGVVLSSAKIIFDNTPDVGIGKIIASNVQDNLNEAVGYYDRSILISTDQNQKAELYLLKSKLYNRDNQKAKSKQSALQALIEVPSYRDAYKHLGDLYMRSYEDCKKGESRVKDRLVYIAAHKMYMRGGHDAKARQAIAQFPSAEEIFTENYEVGQELKVDCWINETVSLQKRPN